VTIGGVIAEQQFDTASGQTAPLGEILFIKSRPAQGLFDDSVTRVARHWAPYRHQLNFPGCHPRTIGFTGGKSGVTGSISSPIRELSLNENIEKIKQK
jgi:hypothetical protein